MSSPPPPQAMGQECSREEEEEPRRHAGAARGGAVADRDTEEDSSDDEDEESPSDEERRSSGWGTMDGTATSESDEDDEESSDEESSPDDSDGDEQDESDDDESSDDSDEDEQDDEEEASEHVEDPPRQPRPMVSSSAARCCVCMEPWTSDGEHRVCCIPCGHVYGRSCLDTWLGRSKNTRAKCPQCGKKYKEKHIINLYSTENIWGNCCPIDNVTKSSISSGSHDALKRSVIKFGSFPCFEDQFKEEGDNNLAANPWRKKIFMGVNWSKEEKRARKEHIVQICSMAARLAI